MKLKNKKTGEVVRVEFLNNWQTDDGTEIGFRVANTLGVYSYNSLAGLNEEWEDYEEPKDTNYWYIDSLGKIEFHSTILDEIVGTPNNAMIRKIIGNYFETKEEAEKAVEKLKALTEAKEDGLKIKGYYYNHEDLVILADIGKCNKLTLDTLFGKEID